MIRRAAALPRPSFRGHRHACLQQALDQARAILGPQVALAEFRIHVRDERGVKLREFGGFPVRVGHETAFRVDDGRDRMVEREFGQVRLPDLGLRTIAVALHVGDERQHGVAIAGIGRVAGERPLHELAAALPLAGHGDAQAELAQQLGVLRIGGQRQLADAGGLGDLAVEEQRHHQGLQAASVVGIEVDGPTCRLPVPARSGRARRARKLKANRSSSNAISDNIAHAVA